MTIKWSNGTRCEHPGAIDLHHWSTPSPAAPPPPYPVLARSGPTSEGKGDCPPRCQTTCLTNPGTHFAYGYLDDQPGRCRPSSRHHSPGGGFARVPNLMVAGPVGCQVAYASPPCLAAQRLPPRSISPHSGSDHPYRGYPKFLMPCPALVPHVVAMKIAVSPVTTGKRLSFQRKHPTGQI